MSDYLFYNCRACTLTGDDYGLIDDAAIWVRKDRIAWIGPRRELPINVIQRIDLQGALVLPGLIDCHTHLVYGGNRANEFEQRLNGVSYADIAKAGGGILSTVRATRAAETGQLYAAARRRAETLMREGVTGIEIKSGYGLSLDAERRCLTVNRQLAADLPLAIQSTCLAAHALPPEFAGRSDDYIDWIITDLLPPIRQENLADAVDVFCEKIGFTREQSERLLRAARALGFAVKMHAEQLSDMKGARLTADLGGLSADHLEFLAAEDVPHLAQHGTVAVLLPGAYYFLRETQLPPMEALRAQRVPMALATDHNPGTSPTLSLLLMLNMACTLFRMTPLEAIRGVTVHAARALGWQADRGTLALNMRADMAMYAVDHPAELCYRFGDNPCLGRVFAGQWQPFT